MIQTSPTVSGAGDFALSAPSPVTLADFGALRRLPTRPEEFRDADFDSQFDSDTLAYDAFRLPDGRVALPGPPLFNLKPALQKMSVTAGADQRACPFTLREMDRHMRIIVDAPRDAQALSLTIEGKTVSVPIQPGASDVFAGRRVLFTLSRNNHLNWIRDWVCYARDLHGADAVLFYDNASTLYSAADLLETLSGIEGIGAARVVEWPFKYGPQGLDAKRFWDSDFCQRGAWEHARWKFLAQAKSAQNADVDELVVSSSGRSVFEAAETSPFGIVSYRGRWIMGTKDTAIRADSNDRRHLDYDTVLRVQPGRRFGLLPVDTASCAAKWTVVPSRCPEKVQWGVHSITGWLPSRIRSRDFSYRHFREISDNWKYSRDDRDAFDPAVHEHDDLMLDHFARANW